MIKIHPDNILTQEQWTAECDQNNLSPNSPLRNYNTPVLMRDEYTYETKPGVFLAAVIRDKADINTIRYLCRGVGSRPATLQHIWDDTDAHLVLARNIYTYANASVNGEYRPGLKWQTAMIPALDDDGLPVSIPLVQKT